jgi:Fur family ferric uptake transcriptional regulator
MAGRLRSTRQRDAIRAAFSEHPHPMTPTEVLGMARKYCDGLGIATVYRTLKLLCRDGWLVQLELPGEQVTYYERAQKHHHHFVCRICSTLFKVDGCPVNLEELTPDGCILEDHELLLYGVCLKCRPRKSRRRTAGRKPK